MSIRTNFQILLNKIESEKKTVLNELDFKDKEDFKEYTDDHNVRDTTKVTIDGKEMKAGEVNDVESQFDSKIQKTLDDKVRDKVKDNLDKIAYASEEDKKEFPKALDKLLSGEKLSDDEKKMVAKYAKMNDSGKQFKIYFASREPGDFRQGAREKGVEIGDSSGKLRAAMKDAGLEDTPAVTTGGGVKPKIGGKDLTPGKISGKKREDKIEKELDEDGNVSKVKVGDLEMKRIKKPDSEKLLAAYREQGMSEKEAKNTVERTNRAIDRHNQMLNKYKEFDKLEFNSPVDGLEGLPHKERGDKIAEEYPKIMANKIKEMLGENPTEAELAVVSKVEGLSKIKDPKEYEDKCIEILGDMDNIDSMRKGSADLAESFTYAWMNKKGIRTEMPAGETVKVSDVISFGNPDVLSKLDPDSPEYAKELAKQGLPFLVTLEGEGGVSIKKDGGAASGARAKIEESTFKDPPGDKQVKEVLTSLVDNHNSFMGTKKEPATDEVIDEGRKLLDEKKDWALKNGVLTEDDLPLKYGNRTAKEWAEDTLKDWKEKGKGPFLGGDARMLKMLEGHCEQGLLLEKIHNKTLDSQNYGNVNVKTKGKDKGMQMTDGITNASLMGFQPNPGFDFIKVKDDDGSEVFIPRPNAVYAGKLNHAEYDAEKDEFVSSKKNKKDMDKDL